MPGCLLFKATDLMNEELFSPPTVSFGGGVGKYRLVVIVNVACPIYNLNASIEPQRL
jgi:hypothetical protein